MPTVKDKYRAVTWRYELASALVDSTAHGIRNPPADEITHQLAWLLADSHEFLSIDMIRVYGGIGEAYKLFVDKVASRAAGSELYGSALMALELETMVLAGARSATIATSVGLTVDTVEAYEKLFFDVRSRLNMTAWVCGTVLEPLRVVAEDEKLQLHVLLPRLVRAYGYLAKNYNLAKLFLRTIDSKGIRAGAKSGGAKEAALADLIGVSVQQAVLATRMIDPSNPRVYRTLMETFAKISESARERGAEGGEDKEVYRNAVQKLFQAVEWGCTNDPTQPAIIPAEVLQLTN